MQREDRAEGVREMNSCLKFMNKWNATERRTKLWKAAKVLKGLILEVGHDLEGNDQCVAQFYVVTLHNVIRTPRNLYTRHLSTSEATQKKLGI